MDNLLKKARTLFCAWRKVKLLGLAMLFFSSPGHAGTAYGPYVIEQSALWLPDYLAAALMAHGYAGPGLDWTAPEDRRRVDLLIAVKRLAYDFRLANFELKSSTQKNSPFLRQVTKRGPRIEFRPGGDRKFDLPGKPPRMAVTGTAIDSKVIFNLGLISDPRKFNFGDALGLWVHELGHKLEPGKFTQSEIDDAAAWLAKAYARQMQIYKIGGLEFLVLNPVPYAQEGESFAGPWPGFPQRHDSLFAALDGTELTDLTERLNAELDRFAHPMSNKLETKRPILAVVKLRETADALELRLELRTARLPKNMQRYAADEIGPNYYKSARVLLSRDLKRLEVSRYVDEPAPRPLITDAEAEFLAPHFSVDRRELRFTLKLHLKNRTHFHAAGYPEAYFTVHALLDGEPVRLEAKIRYKLDDAIGGMPHEVHQKEITKEGRVSVNVGELRGQDLELIGMQDRFFTLGRGFQLVEEEQKRVNVREPLVVALPGCETALRP